MKKAQTEMIGIVMIIILLAVIGLVFLYFALKPDEGFEDLRSNIQVNNLIIAMMKTNLNECEHSIKETIVEYYNNCPNGKICGDKECGYLKDEVENILKMNFEKYEFRVVADNQDLIKIGSCVGGIASNYIIHEENKDFLAVLKQC